jgi:hypothetical protein
VSRAAYWKTACFLIGLVRLLLSLYPRIGIVHVEWLENLQWIHHRDTALSTLKTLGGSTGIQGVDSAFAQACARVGAVCQPSEVRLNPLGLLRNPLRMTSALRESVTRAEQIGKLFLDAH